MTFKFARLRRAPLLSLEDAHFEYLEKMQLQGKLSAHQKRRLWTIERELNRRARQAN